MSTPSIPLHPEPEPPVPRSWRNIYLEKGPKAFAEAINNYKPVLFMDTTWRGIKMPSYFYKFFFSKDAHQSLLMTRMRTKDIKNAAYLTRHTHANSFYSLECWGGATFDVALRFLHECPWDRLAEIRELWFLLLETETLKI